MKLIQRINCGKIPIDFVWSWTFKCNVMTYVNNLKQMLFHYHPNTVGLFYTRSYNKLRVLRFLNVMVS